MELWTYEQEAWETGTQTVCGVDEAGAGPLAGPVYAAAVILPRGLELPGLNDSKKLTEKRREALFDQIIAQAEAYQGQITVEDDGQPEPEPGAEDITLDMLADHEERLCMLELTTTTV